MKGIFFALASCFCVTAYAQYTDSTIQLPRYFIYKGPKLQQVPLGLLTPNAQLVQQNKNGNVYSLATDQMPCLVPNAKDCVPIPTKKLMAICSNMPNARPNLLR